HHGGTVGNELGLARRRGHHHARPGPPVEGHPGGDLADPARARVGRRRQGRPPGHARQPPGLPGVLPLVRHPAAPRGGMGEGRRGTDGRAYPWGNPPPTPESCNHTMQVGDTTPVDRYPDATGFYGPEDMAGNVWEMMGNGYHRYPYNPHRTKRLVTR